MKFIFIVILALTSISIDAAESFLAYRGFYSNFNLTNTEKDKDNKNAIAKYRSATGSLVIFQSTLSDATGPVVSSVDISHKQMIQILANMHRSAEIGTIAIFREGATTELKKAGKLWVFNKSTFQIDHGDKKADMDTYSAITVNNGIMIKLRATVIANSVGHDEIMDIITIVSTDIIEETEGAEGTGKTGKSEK